ncbi:MAG: hypothetical protein ACD_75C02438G0001 [uncultured bacterium]|nr:MAG: hypothetical protein ACD_75C02438G0001 [uncultured bacterium]
MISPRSFLKEKDAPMAMRARGRDIPVTIFRARSTICGSGSARKLQSMPTNEATISGLVTTCCTQNDVPMARLSRRWGRIRAITDRTFMSGTRKPRRIPAMVNPSSP